MKGTGRIVKGGGWRAEGSVCRLKAGGWRVWVEGDRVERLKVRLMVQKVSGETCQAGNSRGIGLISRKQIINCLKVENTVGATVGNTVGGSEDFYG